MFLKPSVSRLFLSFVYSCLIRSFQTSRRKLHSRQPASGFLHSSSTPERREGCLLFQTKHSPTHVHYMTNRSQVKFEFLNESSKSVFVFILVTNTVTTATSYSSETLISINHTPYTRKFEFIGDELLHCKHLF